MNTLPPAPIEYPEPPHVGEPMRDPGAWQQNVQPELERLEILEAQT